MIVLVVMIVIVMLTLAGLSFVWTLSTENKAAHLHGEQLQLGQALTSGQEYVRAICSGSRQRREEMGDLSDNETLFRDVVLDCDAEGRRQARISILAPPDGQRDSTGNRYGLLDESAKLNLAVLQQWEQSEAGVSERALMNLPGMTETIAAAILDWIDADTTPRPSGAEAEYYTSRGLPYVPRNGVPASLEELLLVRDVGRYQLLGADVDVNYRVDGREMQVASATPGGGATATNTPWSTMLTMYSAERNTTSEGQPRIDLNQDDLESLYAELEDVFDTEKAAFIIAYRQFGPDDTSGTRQPTTRRGAARPRPTTRSTSRSAGRGQDDPDRWLDLSQPAQFEVESIFDLIGAQVLVPPDRQGDSETDSRYRRTRRRATSTGSADSIAAAEDEAEERIIRSPFEDDPAAMRDYLAELLDRTAVDSRPVIRGRINVHQAPREVLVGIPGVESDTVDRILSARLSHAGSEATIARRHAIWLLAEEVVDLAQMKRLAPFVTGGGDVFRGQIVAVLDDSPLAARAEVVIDSTATPPRQVYWKDLSLLGRGFPPEVVGGALARGAE
jgi:hypothetical protein